MRKALLVGGIATSALMAQSAWADVNVFANVEKTKTITVTELLVKAKSISVSSVVVVDVAKAAESLALVNQENTGNKACENCAERNDIIGGTLTGEGAINNNAGIVTLNQATGNMNNQGNNVAVAVDIGRGTPPPPGEEPPPPQETGPAGFAEAQAHTDQRNGVRDLHVDITRDPITGVVTSVGWGFTGDGNVVDAINLVFREGGIDNSINLNTGVAFVNQAPGNMNNQANNLAMALSFPETVGVALAEADLGQYNAFNQVLETGDGFLPAVGINKAARIGGSITGNAGIVGVNQAVGNMANQSNTMAVAAVVFVGVQ